MPRVNKKAAVLMLALALPFTAQHEGLWLKSYLDPVGISTICYGETLNVTPGMTKTEKECKEMLSIRLAYFGYEVDKRITVDIEPPTHAAITSFAYNVGLGNLDKSTLLKKINRGDIRGACNELSKWVFAKGQKLNGLVNRREAEKQLCLKGIQ